MGTTLRQKHVVPTKETAMKSMKGGTTERDTQSASPTRPASKRKQRVWSVLKKGRTWGTCSNDTFQKMQLEKRKTVGIERGHGTQRLQGGR